ncbi:glycerophosphodiester phosphodiesterase [Geodermatophilus sp. DSM 44513]|uniref:glycerophosphodiester phosphodiesterase n=1 Tax=Geodermatophilus sp. DSM 44513 TaxID=1528104 RepID=UPI00127F773E|nr:glycerophosphodiester phosphodiesterase [Geodermatophilus sp. DSM 44513]WNV77741.1 glycerophosphodiester phosphodiesterase [Geodermatophilus sp. DSM 44513]
MVPARYAFLDGPTPLAMAHRGGAIEHLENSLPAFEACVAMGYRYLETDVRVTADGVPVVFHDAVLDRVTDRTGRVDQLTWAQLSGARIGGREPVLRLEDLLGAWADVRFNLDVKAPGVVAPLARTVRRLGVADRICVASFSDARVAAARRVFGPGVCTSLGPRGVAALRLSSYSPRAAGLVRIPAGCAQVPLQLGGRALVDERFIAAAHAQGLQVHVWTVDTEEEATRVLDLGVDGVMTDRPAMLRALLQRRGQWTGRPAA